MFFPTTVYTNEASLLLDLGKSATTDATSLLDPR